MTRNDLPRRLHGLARAVAIAVSASISCAAAAAQGRAPATSAPEAQTTSPTRWTDGNADDAEALSSQVAAARRLSAAAGVVGAPVVAGSIVAVTAVTREEAPKDLARWVGTIEKYRKAIADELGRPPGRPGQRGADEGWMVFFIAADEAQARIVRAGALEDTTPSSMGPPAATVHRRPGVRDVVIVLDGSDEAGRVAEDLLMEVASASLHQLVSEGEVPPWMVEAIAAGAAKRIGLALPGLDASRAELVKAIRENPAKALRAFAQGTDAPPGAGMLARELLARDRPDGLAKAILLIKDGTGSTDAVQRATGIAIPRLADGMARWYQTND